MASPRKSVKLKEEPESFDLARAVSEYLSALNRGKKGYKSSDAKMDLLEKEMQPGQIILLPNGKKVRFVDQWAGKTRVNAGLNVRKYAFEDVIE